MRNKSPDTSGNIKAAIKAAVPPKPQPTDGGAPQPTTPRLKDKVMQTIYMPFGVHDALRKQAFEERCSQQDIIRRAVSNYLKAKGHGTWEELEKVLPPQEPGGAKGDRS
jgi:hypothetical protein